MYIEVKIVWKNATMIISFKKKKNEVINKKAEESYENAKIWYICPQKN